MWIQLRCVPIRAVGRFESPWGLELFGGDNWSPPGWDRVNWSNKIWGCHGNPGNDIPSYTVAMHNIHSFAKRITWCFLCYDYHGISDFHEILYQVAKIHISRKNRTILFFTNQCWYHEILDFHGICSFKYLKVCLSDFLTASHFFFSFFLENGKTKLYFK